VMDSPKDGTQNAIALQQVSKTYANGMVALKAIDLAIAPHQFVSLVGASGCGKSTILRLMSGLTKPTTGQIERADLRLAYVFQDPALMPWATVQENVYLPLKLQGMTRKQSQDAIASILDLVNLTGFEQYYPRQLSGGMKMRVSIARALVTEPELLLMDEPFGALDDMTRSKLNSDLLDLWLQKRWTVVFVTHNLYEAVYLSNRVVVMSARPGQIVGDLAIAADYPRPEAFRTSSICNQYCRDIAAILR
jgi:NitT/TauT family transport system ATP-binding protein